MSDKQEKQEPEAPARENGAKEPSGMVTVDVASYTRMVSDLAKAKADIQTITRLMDAAMKCCEEQRDRAVEAERRSDELSDELNTFREYINSSPWLSDFRRWMDEREKAKLPQFARDVKPADNADKESEAV